MNFYEQIFSRGRATGEGMTHFERLFAAKFGGSPAPEVREYTGAVPVTITADGTPLIDLLISGNEEHTGTPTPDNPIMPQGTGERTENLVFVSVDNLTYYLNYNQLTISDGTITVTGRMLIGFKVKVEPNTTYTVSAVYSHGKPLMRIREYTEIPDDWTEGFIGQPVNTNDTSATFTTSSEAEWILVAFYSEVVGVTIDNIMLNTGSTAPSTYIPYGYKLDISSANTTTPVYLGEVETTRKIKKAVFKGDETENWGYSSSGNNARVFLPVNSMAASPSVSTHYQFGVIRTYPNLNEYCINNASALVIGVDINSITSATDFKTYLQQQYAAGTPVTVWYVLATEETAVVNEPLMRIGDYADTLSKEQAGVEIPTNNGSTTVDVDTTLKPSEVYIKYMG